MNRIRNLTVCICLFFVQIGYAITNPDEKSNSLDSRSDQRRHESIVLRSTSLGSALIDVQLGSIEIGKTYVFTLDLKNELGSDLRLEAVKTECSCTRAKVPEGVIESGGTTQLEFHISVGEKQRKSAQLFSAEIKAKGAAERVLIKIRGTIENLVAFENDMYLFDLKKASEADVQTILLTVVATTPDLLKNCEIEIGDWNAHLFLVHVIRESRA